MHKFIVFSIILIEGFVSIATEIITMRQLLPVVGNSVTVTSYIIGVFLLALAYGYKRGGKYTDNYATVLQRNFLIASLLLGVGLSYRFVMLFFMQIHTGALLLYLILVTVPLVYLLGQTLPITMNLFKKTEPASVIGSTVLHISTLGSFLGSILTTVLFMNYIGVTWTIVINSALLAVAAIMLAEHYRLKTLAACLAIVPLVLIINLQPQNHKILHTNAHNTYQILEPFYGDTDQVGKLLVVNNSGSSFVAKDSLAGSKYIEMIKTIIFDDLKLHNQEILVLGAGGFSLSAAKTHDNRFIYVDIDPDLPKVTEQHFLPKINGEFINQDARQFLLHADKQYPVIVADTYGNGTSIPGHLLTKEYFNLLHDRLTANGVAIINVIINPLLQDQYSKSIDLTIRTVFDNCMAIPRAYVNEPKNVLYVCNKNHGQLAQSIYVDDLNRSFLDKSAIN